MTRIENRNSDSDPGLTVCRVILDRDAKEDFFAELATFGNNRIRSIFWTSGNRVVVDILITSEEYVNVKLKFGNVARFQNFGDVPLNLIDDYKSRSA